ncbi:seven-hairpin glycosidase [Hymenopellis radicata]|nr:seven-hairpin glycosidase [Hymenopellis radicata]
MLVSQFIPFVTVLALPYTCLGDLIRVQNPDLQLPGDALVHREAVKEIFLKSYAAYHAAAFGHDDLDPVSNTSSDGRNGWGASIVDAMSTMKIMGLDDLFAEAVDFAGKIDFSRSQTADTVSVFETTIRYLGGLLSAFELGGKNDTLLVQKAAELANKMAFAWRDKTQLIPFGFLDFTANTPTIATSNIAEAGSLVLEWSTMTKYSGNATYTQLTEGALKHIATLPAPLPGLAAQGIDPSSGEFVGSSITWGGGSDSYFEYLIKHARLSNTDDNVFADTWATAVDSTIKILFRTSTVGDHLYTGDTDSSKRVRHVGSHLACFTGGNWMLGGKMLRNDTIVNYGLALNDACWNTYASTATGIGPEAFAYISSDGNFTGGSAPTPAQQAFYSLHGFYITSSVYILRPEVLESNFYAWRVTGDQKYQHRTAH